RAKYCDHQGNKNDLRNGKSVPLHGERPSLELVIRTSNTFGVMGAILAPLKKPRSGLMVRSGLLFGPVRGNVEEPIACTPPVTVIESTMEASTLVHGSPAPPTITALIVTALFAGLSSRISIVALPPFSAIW